MQKAYQGVGLSTGWGWGRGTRGARNAPFLSFYLVDYRILRFNPEAACLGAWRLGGAARAWVARRTRIPGRSRSLLGDDLAAKVEHPI